MRSAGFVFALWFGCWLCSHMVTALNSVTYPLHAQLLGTECLEIHHWIGADVGHAFFWQQRAFLAAFGYADGVAHRKQQVRRGILEKLVSDWGLPASACVHGARGDPERLQTTVFDTSVMMAWLFTTLHNASVKGFER